MNKNKEEMQNQSLKKTPSSSLDAHLCSSSSSSKTCSLLPSKTMISHSPNKERMIMSQEEEEEGDDGQDEYGECIMCLYQARFTNQMLI